jgi:hypothetical protein
MKPGLCQSSGKCYLSANLKKAGNGSRGSSRFCKPFPATLFIDETKYTIETSVSENQI